MQASKILKSKSFEVDTISFEEGAFAITNKLVGLEYSRSFCALYFSSELTEIESSDLEDLWNSLESSTEAAKLALASRKSGKDLSDFLNEKKQLAAVKSWNDMSVGERKLMSGAQLTSAEIDAL
jgi:hypothetical protein